MLARNTDQGQSPCMLTHQVVEYVTMLDYARKNNAYSCKCSCMRSTSNTVCGDLFCMCRHEGSWTCQDNCARLCRTAHSYCSLLCSSLFAVLRWLAVKQASGSTSCPAWSCHYVCTCEERTVQQVTTGFGTACTQHANPVGWLVTLGPHVWLGNHASSIICASAQR